MNRIDLVTIAMAVLVAGPATAGEITADPEPFVSVATRAQVQEELKQHRAAGIDPWASDYDQLAGFRSGMSRAEVTAEFIASRDATSAFTGEDSGSSYLARMQAPVPQRATELAVAD